MTSRWWLRGRLPRAGSAKALGCDRNGELQNALYTGRFSADRARLATDRAAAAHEPSRLSRRWKDFCDTGLSEQRVGHGEADTDAAGGFCTSSSRRIQGGERGLGTEGVHERSSCEDGEAGAKGSDSCGLEELRAVRIGREIAETAPESVKSTRAARKENV